MIEMILMSYGRLSLEDAEVKLLSALSYIVWILPGLAALHMFLLYIEGNLANWRGSPFMDPIVFLMGFVILMKVITLVDKNIDAERVRRTEIDKRNYQERMSKKK